MALIIQRIVEMGSWDSMKWLRRTYSKDQILSYLMNAGKRKIPDRDLNYWLLVMGVSADERNNILNEENKSNCVWKNRNSH